MTSQNECVDSSYKLCFTLKQHTPIIHFQAKQKGATLRATELKPKLDRFLITQLGDGDYKIGKVKAKKKGWLIGKGKHPALDYKVRIEDKSLRYEEDKGRNFPGTRGVYQIFMGNMDNNPQSKEPFFTKIDNNYSKTIHFKCFNENLIKIIKKNFSKFLMQTNFGTAQSKGFGCYSVIGEEKMHLINGYKFTITSSDDDAPDATILKVFTYIYYFYKMLKSGINEKDKNRNTIFYGKSLLWLYAKIELECTWDKKIIKKKFFSEELETQIDKYKNKDNDILTYGKVKNNEEKYEFLLRDLFGFSPEVEWQDPYNANLSKTHLPRQGENEIKRFQSPIMFKPIETETGYDVYFWGKDIPHEILGESFKISNANDSFTIKTPEIFDISKYLKFVSEQTILTHIHSDWRSNNSIYNILDEIFSTLDKVENND